MSSNVAFTERAATSRALRALSAPVFVLGLEWVISGTNKIIGNFISAFSPYVSALQAAHIFLPGLSWMVRHPLAAAWLAVVTENGLGIALVLSSLCFFLGAHRIGEVVGGTALAISAVVAAGLWLIVGSPPFWPTGNGFQSGWSVEFFLICISAALAIAVALADPEATPLMRGIRLLRSIAREMVHAEHR